MFLAIGFLVGVVLHSRNVAREARQTTRDIRADPQTSLGRTLKGIFRVRYKGLAYMVPLILVGHLLDLIFDTTLRSFLGF